jgi:hypothetical protein
MPYLFLATAHGATSDTIATNGILDIKISTVRNIFSSEKSDKLPPHTPAGP